MTDKLERLGKALQGLFSFEVDEESPQRYDVLRRNLMILMVLVTFVPLLLMAGINYHEYRSVLQKEIVTPLRGLVNKTKHSFELFLAERVSAVSFIARAYPYEELADPQRLNRIFNVMKQEFTGFVDLGLIDANGVQVNYVGPYDLKGKDYSEQGWYHEVRVRGTYVSDVFMGYRRFPHLVIAVEQLTDRGDRWILRATIDTQRFQELIASMGLDPESDAFLVNREGVFQTPSRFYGGVLSPCPLPVPRVSYQADVIEAVDPNGRPVFVAYAHLVHPGFVLMVVKPRAQVLQAWTTLKSELLLLFFGGTALIFLVVYKLTGILVRKIREADERREAAFREMQHHHKLSSIGRLAAGVAHEINNPLAIINEKAGLMKDLMEHTPDFPKREKFLALVQAILQSVDRCRNITHRLLGFARRMDVQIEVLDLNDVIGEVLGFLEKEALYRNIDLRLQLAENLPRIASDRGQLQQVLLNILNNAFAAVDDGGIVSITTWDADLDRVAVSIQDNGHGMNQETLKHIFEPFFTTKKGYGTGLGLPITYGIVKKLGGCIEVQSEEGRGTTFTVYLPKKPPEFTKE
ncbi:MAG: two-component sensor histidine kinase [Desulfacinum sp.]|nr:two-component sensor histidine kinase [Desulfacinum sp.]